jgi:hypothetical protein
LDQIAAPRVTGVDDLEVFQEHGDLRCS